MDSLVGWRKGSGGYDDVVQLGPDHLGPGKPSEWFEASRHIFYLGLGGSKVLPRLTLLARIFFFSLLTPGKFGVS